MSLPLTKFGFLLDTIRPSSIRDHRQQSPGCTALVTYIGISWRRTLLRPPHVLFLPSIPSLCLLAPSFIPTFFLRSSITLYISSLLSFTRASSPSFCRFHAVIAASVASPIHHLDLLSSVLHPPPFFSFIVLWSASLQLTAPGHGAVAGQLHLVLLMLERWLSPPPSTHRLRPFCCRPFVSLSFRSVHLSSWPETIRCIPPSLSRSVSPLFCPSFISHCLPSNNSSRAVRRTLQFFLSFAIRNNFTGKRSALHLAGILPFRVALLILTAENSCKCNVMVMFSLILDLSVVTESINGNSDSN